MSTAAPDTADALPASQAAPPLNERELAEVIGSFNEVTAKLHGAHESLRREVGRLKTELRVANEQLERSRRLAALGEMAAGIAHEVRNPLGSIRLYAQMLEEDLGDRPGERGIAEKIGRAVRGLDAVVGDVLAFAREMRVRSEVVDAGELIERAIEECLAEGGKDARPVEVERGAGMGLAEVCCDPSLVHRALVNVVRNAVQAMREDGACVRPVLGVEAAGCTALDPAGNAREFAVLRVTDNGPGVPPDVLARMFNPFFTTRATGTGLGLAIVHRIIDAHGGRVVVKSGDSAGMVRGTVVELMFPGVGEVLHAASNATVSAAEGLAAV